MSHLHDDHNETVRRFILNLWAILWSRLWVLIICITLGCLLAFAIILTSEKSYRSSAAITLDIMKLASFNDEVIHTSFLADDLIVDTEIQIMSSIGVAERVLTLGESLKILGGEELTEEEIRQNALKNLARGLHIQREGSTSLVTVYFTHNDPEFAAFIADGLVDVYIDFKQDLQSQRIEHKREYLELEIQSTLRRLQEAENNTVQFARASGLPHDSEKTLNQLEEEILKRDQIEQSVQLLLKEQNYNSLEALSANSQDPLQLHGSILVQQINPQISFVQSKYTEASLEIATLIAAGNPPPENSSTMRNLEALGESLIELVIAARDVSLSEFELSKNRLAETAARYEDVRQKTELSISDQNALQKLKDDEEAIRTEFDNLNAQLQNIWSQNNFLQAPAERISTAIPSLTPFAPNPMRILVSSLAISIMLFGLYVLISRQLFAKIELADDVPFHENMQIIELFKPSKLMSIFKRNQPDKSRLDAFTKLVANSSGKTVGLLPLNHNCATRDAIQLFAQSATGLGYKIAVLNMSNDDRFEIPDVNIQKHLGNNLDTRLKDMRTTSDIIFVISENADSLLEIPESLSHCDAICMLINKGSARIDQSTEALNLMGGLRNKTLKILFQH